MGCMTRRSDDSQSPALDCCAAAKPPRKMLNAIAHRPQNFGDTAEQPESLTETSILDRNLGLFPSWIANNHAVAAAVNGQPRAKTAFSSTQLLHNL